MRSLRLFPVVMMMLVLAATLAAQVPAGQAARPAATSPAAPPMTMTMSFPDGASYPLKYSALGAMMSPEIHWTNAPAGTVSFVVHMNDIDYSRNHTMEGMLHWLVWNIPASATGLPAGLPIGRLQNGAYQTSASGPGTYRAPRGPGRKHHYVFELFALNTELDGIQPGPDPFDTRANVLKAMQGHILSRAAWVTTFGPNPPR